MEEIESTNEVANVPDWQPSIRLQRFVQSLFQSGHKGEAEKVSGYSKRCFYRHLQNPQFKEWYLKKVDTYINGLLSKAARTLDRTMDSDNEAAAVQAAKIICQLSGKLQPYAVKVDNRTQNFTFVDLIKQVQSEGEKNAT